ncbi:cytochrome P450 superfamily domain protein [Mycobacterium xenopi 4042]|uniref:Cytochrome P450 superfamily domain protein n=1 Tax=Mycobacterium xenopi 4042 TaxID=1299334 RepID=X7Z4I6_MYCXE|nr:cytochrome P450 superfamily domain protein [Mycobacterium xenopi 4042]
MHLARLEMRVALNLLFDRLPNLRLDPDGTDPHIRARSFGRRRRCRCCSTLVSVSASPNSP